jgi:vanillate O-demethylase ferredoxin subunit
MSSAVVWTEAVVQATRDVTPSVREFTLATTSPSLPYAAGSHLQVELLINGQPHTRSYSLIGQDDDGLYRIAVKQLPLGRGGSLAMWRLAPGDLLRISAPRNFFPLSLAAPGYLLLAGGIGITPLVLMAQTLAKRGAPVRLVQGARTASELAYGDVLRAALGDRLTQVVDERGERIDLTGEIAALPAGGQLYVCGPAPMLEAARQAWASAGRPAHDLRFETFGSSGHLAPQPFGLKVPRQGIDITVAANESLLDALELAGVSALSNCRRGECGLCALDVLALDGVIDHRDVFLSAHEHQQNQRICVCVSRVVGSISLDIAYRAGA